MENRYAESNHYGTPRQAAKEHLSAFQAFLEKRNFDLQLRSPTSGQKELDTLVQAYIETLTPYDDD